MSHVRRKIIALAIITELIFTVCLPLKSSAQTQTEGPLTRARAEAIVAHNENRPEYKEYAGEFQQWDENFNASSRNKNKCLFKGSYGGENVNLLLVITADGVITQAMPDKKTEQAICVGRAYTGLKVKPPPLTPFVIQLITSGTPLEIIH
jgi:hypothetical protein